MVMKKDKVKLKEYIRKTLILYTVSIVMLIIILFSIALWFNFRSVIVEKNKNANQDIRLFIERQISLQLESVEEIKNSEVIHDGLITGDNKSGVNRLLYDYGKKNQVASLFALFDSDGSILYTNIYEQNKLALSKSTSLRYVLQDIEYNGGGYFTINPVTFVNGQDAQLVVGDEIESEGETIGYILLFLRDEYLEYFFRTQNMDAIIVSDSYDNIIFSMDKNVANSSGKVNHPEVVSLFSSLPFYTVSSYLDSYGIKISTMSSVQPYRQIFLVCIVLLILIGILIISFGTLVADKVMKKNLVSLDSLIKGVKQLEQGNLQYRITETTFEEFQMIFDEFNNMTTRIELLIGKNNDIAERKRIMELKHLKDQFNPHFVYNIIEIIRYEIFFDKQIASDMIVSFGNLMRYCTNYGNAEVPLNTEIEHINNYLKLQKMRYNDRLHYDINIIGLQKEPLVPKLLLQPIVENSIKHGIENTKNLSIQISVAIDDNVEITVKDNGQGMLPERLKKIEEAFKNEIPPLESIGLYNAYRIIRLLYGEGYGLKIKSIYGEGTTITMIIPLNEVE